MKRRMERDNPLRRCQLVLTRPNGDNDRHHRVALAYFDMPDAELLGLGDISAG